ncbi:MAG: Rod shape-determining protein RodA, partial [uncultured Ramlibacter sp.]
VRSVREAAPVATRSADPPGVRRSAGVCRLPARLRGTADDVLVGLRPWQPLHGPRSQHADRGHHHVRGGPGATTAAHEPGRAALHRGCVAADRRCDLRHHQEGRPALDQRRHRHPAQRDPEDRHAADAGLVVPEAGRAPAADGLRDGRGDPGGARRPDHEAAGPGHVAAGHGRGAVGDLLCGAVLEADHPADRPGPGGPGADDHLRGEPVRRGQSLADPARLPAATHLHLARPEQGPAGQGLPHHPGNDRHRLGRPAGQGLHAGHADAPGVHPGAHHRLHLRSLLRGVRAGRQPVPDRRLHLPDPAGAGHRAGGADPVLAAAGRRHHHDLLHLRLREHGHGERHPARGRRPLALHQLWRNGDGHAGHGAGHPDVDRQGQAPRPVM